MQHKVVMIKDPDSVDTYRDADDKEFIRLDPDVASDCGDVITVTVDNGDRLN